MNSDEGGQKVCFLVPTLYINFAAAGNI